MKKINNYLYFNDNYIYLFNKKNNITIKEKVNKYIKYSKISNITKFIKEYKKILDNNKLNNVLFGDSILIIVNKLYTDADIYMLRFIFEKLNYNKIEIVYEDKFFNLTRKKAYLNILDNYSILYYINRYKELKTVLLTHDMFDTQEYKDYISKRVNKKELYLVGIGNIFKDLANNFENEKNIKTYYYTNAEYYILDNAKK